MHPEDSISTADQNGGAKTLNSIIASLVTQRDELADALRPIAAAYPNDPGTSDLDNEQPVTITLGDVRRVWAALAKLKSTSSQSRS